MNIEQTQRKAEAWFAHLRDLLCAAFEEIEDSFAGDGTSAPGRFVRRSWRRSGDGGGGVASLMRGRVFEKVGVNISTVHGVFGAQLRKEIPGAAEDGRFWASGISVVAHMRSPHIAAAHMNTRYIVTRRDWFGGGADITPLLTASPREDVADFHAAMRKVCDALKPDCYERFRSWCERYFYLPHRGETRGAGGIFYDDLVNGEDAQRERHFAFTQSVGRAFLEVYPRLIRRRAALSWSAEERRRQLVRRGRYVEFNLLYDRGTRFGLLSGGDSEAILMSLPPLAAWP